MPETLYVAWIHMEFLSVAMCILGSDGCAQVHCGYVDGALQSRHAQVYALKQQLEAGLAG